LLTQKTSNHLRKPYAPQRLLTAPLPELLHHFGVELADCPVDDPGFLDAVVEHPDTGRRLLVPAGRSELERDTAVRMLLAAGLGLGGPPLPTGLWVARIRTPWAALARRQGESNRLLLSSCFPGGMCLSGFTLLDAGRVGHRIVCQWAVLDCRHNGAGG
jgi:hypothetical protein